jgi:histidinol-phosphate aminotransferase
MPPQPRPELESIRIATHGGFHADEWSTMARQLETAPTSTQSRPASAQSPQGDFALSSQRLESPEQVIDFSSNVNPFGASPRVRDALLRVPIARHPDPAARELRDALAARLHLTPERVTVGNGSLELLRSLAIAYLRAGDAALIVGPTFGEYRVAAEVMGARVVEVRALPQDDFRLDVDALVARVAVERPRLAFVCNPNNPTGAYLSRAEVERLLAACDETLWVLDEAFVSFAADAWSSVELSRQHENLIVVRSMTKDYALTGLRLGYAFAHPDVVTALNKIKAPWSVNAFAQAAGLVALEDDAHLHETLAAIAVASAELKASIARLDWRVVPSAVHFFLVDVSDARAFRASLARHGLIVRDCASFGLPAFVRIATRRPEENARLMSALRREARCVKRET